MFCFSTFRHSVHSYKAQMMKDQDEAVVAGVIESDNPKGHTGDDRDIHPSLNLMSLMWLSLH